MMAKQGRPLTSKYSVELGFSFNKNLASNLMYWRNAVLHQDIDCAIIVDGGEGYGKSVLGMQVAHFLDKDRHLDIEKQICYYPQQFMDAVQNLEKGKAIVWDEARRGLNRRRSGQSINLSVTDMLAECRQHNLFLIIIMPSFYDMDMNVAVWRTRLLIHVDAWLNKDNPERPLVRGNFRFYTENAKKKLYTSIALRRAYSYPLIKNLSFDATFSHHYVVDEDSYREKKQVAESVYRKKEARGTPNQLIGKMLNFLVKNNWLKRGYVQPLAKHLGIDRRRLAEWRESERANESLLINQREKREVSK